MAFTRIRELDGFNTGAGGGMSGSPQFWQEDIAVLVNQPDTDQLLERNIIFQGLQLTGLVGKRNAHLDDNAMVVLQCPPYAVSLVEKFKNDPPPGT